MGTAKYDLPGYVADTGACGQYVIGVWCPHGFPAHIHIGRVLPDGRSEARLRLRIPDGVFQSLSDDPEKLCRRAMGQAIEGHWLEGSTETFQETRFRMDAQPWMGLLTPLVP